MQGYSLLNALKNKEDLGWTKIIHPYHPLQGQRFQILKLRKVADEDTIILQGTYRGTFAVPREWTEQADPHPYDSLNTPAPILCFRCLIALTKLVEKIEKRS